MSAAPFFAPFAVEARKLNRSLAALLAVAAPSLIAVFGFFMLLRSGRSATWDMWMTSAAGVWAFFMLPMSVTALTALVGHMEHGPKAWDHLRALPVPRWRIYAAKMICVVGVVGAMSVAVPLLSVAALELAQSMADKVREALYGQTFAAPSGYTLTMDKTNHHLHKPVMIGEIQEDGQFSVVWETSSPVRAQPWSPFIEGNDKKPDYAVKSN